MALQHMLIDGQEFRIEAVEMRLVPDPPEECKLYLRVVGGPNPDEDGIGIEGLHIGKVALADLGGRRLHRTAEHICEDDTLETALEDLADCATALFGDEGFVVEEILIDFVREYGSVFRCHLECTVETIDEAAPEGIKRKHVLCDFRGSLMEGTGGPLR